MAKTIKNLKQLKSAGLPTEQPPLQFEAPHAKMARINREMQRTTEALQALNLRESGQRGISRRISAGRRSQPVSRRTLRRGNGN
jgi:hypothetical protein